MRFRSLTEKLQARLQNEISRYPLPDEVEFVALRPHVHAACRERKLLGNGVVGRGSRDLRGADVSVAIERADTRLLARDPRTGCRQHTREGGDRPQRSRALAQ